MVVAPPQRGQLGRINGFQLLKFLGKGTFGAVYQARREADGKVYAIKKVDTRKMTAKERAEAVNEIRVLASVSGEHVITFYEAFVEQDILYIVTEFATHGDLMQLLKNKRRAGHLPEATVWSYFIQMCLGIKAMHDNNILHRDLKAANVFMCSPSYLKLGDLGVAKVLKHDQALASTQVGTPYYVAPEVWRNKAYNSKCDMWSLGCLLYELCTFRPPFEAESMEGLARKVMKGRYEPIPSFYSQSLRSILSKLLVVEPNFRSSVGEILSCEAVLSRMGEVTAAKQQNEHPPHEHVDIVSTIQVPRRFNDVTKNLPPSRYATDLASEPPPRHPVANAAAPPKRAALPQPAGGSDAPARNGADGAHFDVASSEAGDVTRLQRHAGGGNTVANAVASAQVNGIYQQQGRLKLPQRVGLSDSQSQPPNGSGYNQRVGGGHGGGYIPQGGAYAHPYAQPPKAFRLPAVPGALPPTPGGAPTPQQAAVARYAAGAPSREIRMVYHKPNGESRVSIFARGNVSRNTYYNPITHQISHSSIAAGSRYHSRNEPTASQGGAQQQGYNRNLASQYEAQRRRVTPSHWY